MSFTDSLTFGIEAMVGILIFVAFFSGLAPTVIGLIQNAGDSIGMGGTTILVFSLFVLIVVVATALKLFKKFTEPDRPEIQY